MIKALGKYGIPIYCIIATGVLLWFLGNKSGTDSQIDKYAADLDDLIYERALTLESIDDLIKAQDNCYQMIERYEIEEYLRREDKVNYSK